MRLFLLVVLIAGLVAYVIYQRGRNYPVDSIVTPEGRHFEARQIADYCDQGVCTPRAVYLTTLTDTALMKAEAKGLISWLEPKGKATGGQQVIGLIAIKPGFMRMASPERVTQIVFRRVPGPDPWSYSELNDLTSRLRTFLK